MATLVLGGVGLALGGPVGAAIGSSLGAFIDSKYLFPQAEGGGADAEIVAAVGPRVGGLQIQSSSEGGPMAFIVGPTNRIAGQLIWTSGLIEEVVTEFVQTTTQGSFGKGFQRTSTFYEERVTGYNYFADFAFGLGEGPCTRLDKIIANGDVIFENAETTTIISDALRAEAQQIGNNRYVKVIATVVSGIDLSIFESGKEINMSGWATGILNDDWLVTESGIDPSTLEPFVVLQNEDNSNGSEGAANTITIVQTASPFDSNQMGDLRFYPGDLSQTPDPLIEAKEGTGTVPAFRPTCYVVIEKLLLLNFGNQIPQFQFVVQESPSITTGDAIAKILERAGLTADQYDTSAGTDLLQGFHSLGPQSALDLMRPILRFGNLSSLERNGTIVFKKRDDPTIEVIDDIDLAAFPGRTIPVQVPFEITDTFGVDLPSEVVVKFFEPKQEFQEAAQRERRVDVPNNTSVIFNVPVVMDAADARTIARRELWSAWQRRRVITFTLPISYIDLEENDKVELNFEDETYITLLKKIDRGENHVIQIEGVIEDVRTNIQAGEEDTTNPSLTRQVFRGGSFLFEIIDIAPFTNDENTLPGIYFAVAKIDPEAEFNGASILRSEDGQTFNFSGTLTQESVMGFVPAATPAGPTGYFDEGTTIDVTLVNGSLESVTEEALLAGANRCIIGDEVLQFQNAVLISAGIFRISRLLRGLRNTEDKVLHTQTDERFVFIDDGVLQFSKVRHNEIGLDRFFKAVPPNVPSGQVPGFGLTPLESNTLQAFSPSHIEGSRNASDDLTIRWVRRTRALVKHFIVGTATPLLENRELYQVDIFNVAFNTVLDTVTIEGPWERARQPEVIYTAAEQTAVGLVPGAAVNMIIYQLTEIKQRGKGKAATL